MTPEGERSRPRILATAEQQAGELLADAAHRSARRMEAVAADRNQEARARTARGLAILRRLQTEASAALEEQTACVVAALSSSETEAMGMLDSVRHPRVGRPQPPRPAESAPSYFDELRALLDAKP